MDIRLKQQARRRVRTARLARADQAYRFDIGVDSGHVVRTDEGAHLGGAGGAPTSLETLGAALASCQAVQIIRVAEAMRLKIADFTVECVTASGKIAGTKGNDQVSEIDGARLHIAFATDAPAERVERLKALAVDKCPIGRLFGAAGIEPEISWTVRALSA